MTYIVSSGALNSTHSLTPESSLGGIQVADRVRETVPGGRTGNSKSPRATVCAESAARGRLRAVDYARGNVKVCGWTARGTH